jgi:hypothetical protein
MGQRLYFLFFLLQLELIRSILNVTRRRGGCWRRGEAGGGEEDGARCGGGGAR